MHAQAPLATGHVLFKQASPLAAPRPASIFAHPPSRGSDKVPHPCSWRTLVSLQHMPDHVAACCILAACAIARVEIPPRLWELRPVQELQPGTLRGKTALAFQG